MGYTHSRTTKQTGTLPAVDAAGEPYTIVEYTEYLHLENGTTMPGLKEFRLPDGEFVNKVSDTEFKTLMGEVDLRLVE